MIYLSSFALGSEGVVNASNGLRLRSAPNTNGNLLTSLEDQMKVVVLKDQGEWIKVRAKIFGWSIGKYIKNGKVTYKKGLKLLDSPDTIGNVLTVLNAGSKVVILESLDEWRYIEAPITGWVYGKFLKIKNGKKKIVRQKVRKKGRKKGAFIIYEDASSDSDVVAKVKKNLKAKILKKRKNWRYVKVPLVGWIKNKYIDDLMAHKKGGLALKDKPSSKGKTTAILLKDVKVKTLKTDNEWDYVKVVIKGWGSNKYLRSSKMVKIKSKKKKKTRFKLFSSFHYRASGLSVNGTINGQKSNDLSLSSLIGAGFRSKLRLAGDHPLRYSFAFDYYNYANVGQKEVPSGYYFRSLAIYPRLYKMLSPYAGISYEKLIGAGTTNNVMFSLNTLWAEMGLKAAFKFKKKYILILSSSISFSLSTTPNAVNYTISGSSSGIKFQFTPELIYKRKYLIRGGLVLNSLSGDIDLSSTDIVLNVGRKI
ncbi:MAG: SH3 domain-containing protein [Bacteriovoracaceae bacterium]|nr:SH3 domain-containing protein [Bacteriovoracaceae bacterium]